MEKAMTINRRRRTGPLISLVPMIDVMLILLVFFMVTSTYLNLDMIPAARQQDQSPTQSVTNDSAKTIMIRLGADGTPVVRGQPLTLAALGSMVEQILRTEPLSQIMVLPSGAATTQALIAVMDTVTQAGAVRLRVIRLEARQ